MRGVWSFKTAAVAAMLAVAAWPAAMGMTGMATADAPAGVTKAADLFAGQTTDVGDVFVWNDTTNLYVEIDIATGWCMTESHVAVAASASGIPQTKKNNPIPGQFPQGDAYPSCASTDTFTFALAGLGTDPVVAVHVKVWDTDSETTDRAYSTLGDTVYGPVFTYLPPGAAGWGAPSSAVAPAYAAGVWPTITDAAWISTNTVESAPVPDSWRMSTKTLTIPSGAWPIAGSVDMVTSDNAERVCHNGSVIGTDGEVDVPFTDNHEWNTILTYPFTPVVGNNTLDFVWRNYGYCETSTDYCTAPGLNLSPSANPNGLIYAAYVSYYTHSETAWAGTAVGETPFAGANWATYFTYSLEGYVLGDTEADTPYGHVALAFEVFGNVGTTSWARTTGSVNAWEGAVVSATITPPTATFVVRVASGTPAGIDQCDIGINVSAGGAGVGTWNITSVVSSPGETCPYAGQVQGPWTITSGLITVYAP